MAKSKFNLAEVLGDTVSKLNTMQVREIPLDQLEENPDNSYAQTGIDELAESIEIVGLQQPLVVDTLDRLCQLVNAGLRVGVVRVLLELRERDLAHLHGVQFGHRIAEHLGQIKL